MVNNYNSASNFRSPVITEANLRPSLGGGLGAGGVEGDAVLRTPAGNVRALPPPVPQLPATVQTVQPYGSGYNNIYGRNYGFGGMGGYGGFGGLGGYGSSGYGSSFGGYGGGYGGGFGGGYGFNSCGGFGNAAGAMNPFDPEARFIQLAEASTRPAFESIESLVCAMGNIASMLDSTFFAITSTFHAILGMAANFGRLRGVFGQFWQTFAIFRGLKWIYRKILFWLRLSNLDPSSDAFKKAFAEAITQTASPGAPSLPRKGQSPWPVLAFISFIFTAPYLIMKLLGTVTNTAQEEARNPSRWVKPIETVGLYDFQARNPHELSIRANERLFVAPKEIQQSLGLLNTGWALATVDGQNSGILPINYVKSPQQLRQERESKAIDDTNPNTIISQELKQPTEHKHDSSQINLSVSSFAAPPQQQREQHPDKQLADFDLAPQPLGPNLTQETSPVSMG